MCFFSRLLTLAVVCFASLHFAGARIMNGYHKGIELALTSRRNLEQAPLTRNVRQRLAAVEEFIRGYYNTEKMLDEFRRICPALYYEIDTITDRRGRPVDVYVRLLPAAGLPEGLLAATGIERVPADADACASGYGLHSVSVGVAIGDRSLLLLAHEFGHVSYVVRNLAAYSKFFSNNYRYFHHGPEHSGHKPHDRSGKRAILYEEIFRAARRERKSGDVQSSATTPFTTGK